MIGQTISHYPALCRLSAFRKAERDPGRRDKILEKLGEGGMSQNSQRTLSVSCWNFEDPPSLWRRRGL